MLSGLALIFLSPILFLVSVTLLFTGERQIFYTQKRIGLSQTSFNLIKFATMLKNSPNIGTGTVTVSNDPRILPVGKFLRKTKINELPQLINILKGDMSVIGPRPERPEFVEDLEKKIPFYALRNVVKPGLTGWAQVNFPYANNLEEQEIKLRYDIFYIKEQNIYIDFKIIIKTITTVLFFRGQ